MSQAIIPNVIVSAAVVAASTTSFAAVNAGSSLDMKEFNPDLQAVLDDTFSQKSTLEAVGRNLDSLAATFSDSTPEFERIVSENNLMIAQLGAEGSDDSTSGVNEQNSLYQTCYTNCYTNCHTACHGSRGWR